MIPHIKYRHSEQAISYHDSAVWNTTIRDGVRRASLNVIKKEYKYDLSQQDS